MDPDTKRLLRMYTFTAEFPDGRLEFHNMLGKIYHFQKDGQLTLRGMAAIQVRQNLTQWLNRQKLRRYHFRDFILAQIELESLGVTFNLSKWILPGLYYPQSLQIHKDLADISYIGRVIADFAPNFVAVATGVGHGRICLASVNSATPKTPCYTQKSPGISYTSRVTADFVPNIVAMATGVGRSRICLEPFNSPTPKTPCYTQTSRGYLLYRVIADFVPNSVAMATGVILEQI